MPADPVSTVLDIQVTLYTTVATFFPNPDDTPSKAFSQYEKLNVCRKSFSFSSVMAFLGGAWNKRTLHV